MSGSESSFEVVSLSPPASPEAGVPPSGSYRKKKASLQKDTLLNNAMKILGTPADSLQIFGDYIADQLRNMTEVKQKRLRLLIQKAIVAVEEEPEPILNASAVQEPLPPISTIPGPSSRSTEQTLPPSATSTPLHSPQAFSQDMFGGQSETQYQFQFGEY